MVILTLSDLKIVENCIFKILGLDFEGSWPRFWKVWASILEPPGSILECFGTPQNPFSDRQTFYILFSARLLGPGAARCQRQLG